MLRLLWLKRVYVARHVQVGTRWCGVVFYGLSHIRRGVDLCAQQRWRGPPYAGRPDDSTREAWASCGPSSQCSIRPNRLGTSISLVKREWPSSSPADTPQCASSIWRRHQRRRAVPCFRHIAAEAKASVSATGPRRLRCGCHGGVGSRQDGPPSPLPLPTVSCSSHTPRKR